MRGPTEHGLDVSAQADAGEVCVMPEPKSTAHERSNRMYGSAVQQLEISAQANAGKAWLCRSDNRQLMRAARSERGRGRQDQA